MVIDRQEARSFSVAKCLRGTVEIHCNGFCFQTLLIMTCIACFNVLGDLHCSD